MEIYYQPHHTIDANKIYSQQTFLIQSVMEFIFIIARIAIILPIVSLTREEITLNCRDTVCRKEKPAVLYVKLSIIKMCDVCICVWRVCM